jgi:3-oxoacyl-[acyl-carrier protein] reductase
VSVLVNNAGTRQDSLALRMTDDAWQRVLQTNLFGTFACCRRSLRGMLRAGWGRIVNVSSIAGLAGSPGQANYAASKAGVIALTKTLAREVSRKGITVNAIAPGLITTDLTADMPEKSAAYMVERIACGRTGSPEEIAATVGHICSNDASYITGSVFVVDGGLTA